MTDPTNAQRQRAHRERLRAAGLIPVQVWVRPEDAQKVKDLAKQLNEQSSNP